MLHRILLALAAFTALLALPACGGPATGADGPRVVTSTGFAAEMVRAVAGAAARVDQLVPDGASPHSFSPSARDRAALDRADLVVIFGRDLEAQLPVDELDAPTLALADRVDERRLREEPGDDDHEHERDPHVWMDPALMATALPDLARALAAVDPDEAAGYRRRATAAAERLAALDAELRRILAVVPEERRKLVTSHESLGYFAERYRFELVAAPFGLAPDAEPSARAIDRTIRAAREAGVPAVFAQRGDDPRVMRAVARATGARIVDDLLVEGPGPQAPTYAAALRFDARRIAGALAP